MVIPSVVKNKLNCLSVSYPIFFAYLYLILIPRDKLESYLNYIFFRLKFTLGIESTSIADSTIEIANGLTLSTASVLPVARFHCDYPVDVEVTTGEYTITGSPKDDDQVSTPLGDASTLSDGFSFAFDSGDAGMKVGSQIQTTLKWDMPVLSGVTFYLHQCQVETGSFNVKIIDGGCFSAALNVLFGGQADNEIKMSYMAFTDASTQGLEQVQNLNCIIRMCMAECSKPTTDGDCPTTAGAAAYLYIAP